MRTEDGVPQSVRISLAIGTRGRQMSNKPDKFSGKEWDQLLNKLYRQRVHPDKLIDALRDHDAFTKKVVDTLKKRRPADVLDLLNPRQNKFGNSKNITVTYLTFPTWLARFDPKLIRPIEVNINSYRFQRSKHEGDVMVQLDIIQKMDSGKALLQSIEDAKRELCILPYFEFSLYPTALFPAVGLDAATGGWPGKIAYVYITPHMWGARGTARATGPGSNPDEVLFHEMIHGVRGLGTFKRLEGSVGSVVEEMLAIVMTNVYLAEKGQKDMRDPQVRGSFRVLPRPKEWLNQDAISLLAPLKWQQQSFFDALADIPAEKAWWNPFREMKLSPN